MDAAGAGIALKETSAALVENNEIVHCAHGIMADSPMDPINRIVFIGNLVAHNITGVYFYGAKGGHIAIGNTFRNNLWPVTVIGDGDPLNDTWWGNYWDLYEGFDRDHDGYRRPSLRAAGLRRPDLDGDAGGALLPQLAGTRIARLPRAPGALLGTVTDPARHRAAHDAQPRRPRPALMADV